MEILIPILTFMLGYFAEKVLDKMSTFFADRLRFARNRKRKDASKKRRAINAIFTEDIYPCISSDNIWVKDAGKRLFLSFPTALVSQLHDVEGAFATEDASFCDFKLPGRSLEDICNAIEIARNEIALKFINREDGLYFNGDKLGVVFLDSKSRSADTKETPQLLVEFFRTDYFTHRTIERAVELLGLPCDAIDTQSLNTDLQWIRTSFGISIIVVLKSSNQIILTHRSKNASFSEGKRWIYVSATEALSQVDIDEYESTPDLALCVKRGIKEELGISKDMYRDNGLKFYDCFFETQFFQDGIVASVELSENVKPEDILSLRAKDKRLEIQDIFFIDNTKSAIKKFILENQDEMRSQTIFALESYIASL